MELIETLLADMEQQQRESQQREQALMNSLAKQERAFTLKLEQLCKIEPTQENQEQEQEDNITKRLTELEKNLQSLRVQFQEDTSKLIENQQILSNQLKNLQELLSKS